MTPSISPAKKAKKIPLWSIVAWLAIWQAVAMAIGEPIILVSPLGVIKTLLSLARTGEFYFAILFSLLRIASGFLLALVVGVLLSWLSFKNTYFESFVEPLMRVIKSIPVASFIIIVLVWISSRNLSIVISFLIVLPVIYSNTLQALRNTDVQLLEMAKVFRVRNTGRIRYIYLPQTMPYLRSACSIALGLAWKSGIAAEVIGMPLGSMGEKLYQSKIFLDTASLMAWTVTIVLCSWIFEKLFLHILELIERRICR